MMALIQIVLGCLNALPRDDFGDAWIDGKGIQNETGLSPAQINDAIDIAVSNGHARRRTHMGMQQYKFAQVTITPKGRLWLESN